MKEMKKAYAELAADLKQPVDTDKDKYVALVAKMKDEATKDRALVPQLAASLPQDQKDTMVASYQKDLDAFSQSLDALTASIQAGNWDDARKGADTLKQEMIAGHKAYRKKD